MGGVKQVKKAEKMSIVHLLTTGMTQSDVAAIFNVSQSLVSKMWKKHQAGVTLSRKKRMGRPRVTSRRTDLRIKSAILKNLSMLAAQVKISMPGVLDDVAEHTIHHRLSGELKLKSRRPAKKPLVSPKMQRKRLQFCRSYRHWMADDWAKVMFSDESTFQQFTDTKMFVHRPSGSNPVDPRYTKPTVKHSPSIMVWDAFSAKGRAGLFFLPKGITMMEDRYIDILDSHLVNFMEIHKCEWFLQDSAICHKANRVLKWLQDHAVSVMDWPGNSPDLNPIENLWLVVNRKVAERRPTSLPDLQQAICTVWCTEINKEMCQNLVNSMPQRLQMVIKNKGYPTKY